MICLIGTVLKDRYCVMERIGQGGGGSLYLARDMELGVFRAVKETSIIRKQEAKLMRFLEHPAIPKIVDYVEEEEFCYLIMEYIRGQSLGEILKNKGDFSIEETLRLGNEIAKVLEYLHSRKPAVCYGDLKPDNLMLSENGHLYLVDLGSAMLNYCTGTVSGQGQSGKRYLCFGKNAPDSQRQKRSDVLSIPGIFLVSVSLYEKTGEIQVSEYGFCQKNS